MTKGRNRHLIFARNRRLLLRYYQLSEIDRLRFDDTIRKLANDEFFLSETTVIEIVRKFYKKEDFDC